jgi:hypothetical protein
MGESPPSPFVLRLIGMVGSAEQLQFVLSARFALGWETVADQVSIERVAMSDLVSVTLSVSMNVIEFQIIGRATYGALSAEVRERSSAEIL